MESENVKSRFHCKIPYMTMMANRNRRDFVLPNNQEDCEVSNTELPFPAVSKSNLQIFSVELDMAVIQNHHVYGHKSSLI